MTETRDYVNVTHGLSKASENAVPRKKFFN